MMDFKKVYMLARKPVVVDPVTKFWPVVRAAVSGCQKMKQFPSAPFQLIGSLHNVNHFALNLTLS